MSISDIFYSIPFVLTTWAAPAELDYDYLWGNVGTQGTCTFEAFMYQLGAQSTPLFNFLQAFLVLLLIRYQWTERELATKLEPWCHGVFWVYSLAASIFPIPMGLYNNNILICFFGSHPHGCKDSFTYGAEEADCIRGDNAWIYAIVFVFFPLWFCIAGGAICMCLTYQSVRKMEERISRYAGSSSVGCFDASTTTNGGDTGNDDSLLDVSNRSLSMRRKKSYPNTTVIISRERSRAVATQASLYMGAFLLSHTMNAVNSILFFGPPGIYNELFDIFTYILAPLQGVFNAIVFVRLRERMLTREGRCLRRVLFGAGCCCSWWCDCWRSRRRGARGGKASSEDSKPNLQLSSLGEQEGSSPLGLTGSNDKEHSSISRGSNNNRDDSNGKIPELPAKDVTDGSSEGLFAEMDDLSNSGFESDVTIEFERINSP
jgi:hypothetical protein